MNLRLVHCPACRTAYMIEDEAADRPPPCPKCGAVPARPARAELPGRRRRGRPSSSRRRPAGPRRGRKIAAFVAATLVVVVARGGRRLAEDPEPLEDAPPPTRSRRRRRRYLRALVDGDAEAARRLGTVELPPAIRSFRNVRRDPAGDARLKGSFAPIAAFHAQDRGDLHLRPGHRPLHARERPRPRGRRPRRAPRGQGQGRAGRDLQEDAERQPRRPLRRGRGPGQAAGDALPKASCRPRSSSRPTRMLVDDAKPPLPPEERALAKDFADHRDDLGRPARPPVRRRSGPTAHSSSNAPR